MKTRINLKNSRTILLTVVIVGGHKISVSMGVADSIKSTDSVDRIRSSDKPEIKSRCPVFRKETCPILAAESELKLSREKSS